MPYEWFPSFNNIETFKKRLTSHIIHPFDEIAQISVRAGLLSFSHTAIQEFLKIVIKSDAADAQMKRQMLTGYFSLGFYHSLADTFFVRS